MRHLYNKTPYCSLFAKAPNIIHAPIISLAPLTAPFAHAAPAARERAPGLAGPDAHKGENLALLGARPASRSVLSTYPVGIK